MDDQSPVAETPVEDPAYIYETSRYNAETLDKVYDALHETSLDETEVGDAVSALQNAGILFRERV
jgi:hypothetical protein